MDDTDLTAHRTRSNVKPEPTPLAALAQAVDDVYDALEDRS
ncbi:hypothetical protein DEI99_005220 [Curtobacterium sp. MCLR17_036]|nr:hypothetical protein [Curtobacterium sp. MCLR17_036]WIE65940.1 hypothetical protein DEI99_005220 [Curtobacterium sp. MCLR17_036]